MRVPASLENWQASTLPVAGLTAWSALIENAGVRAGDTVLIHSTGGVALFGLQIARAHGAEVILCGRPENEARARELGATHFVDTGRSDWMETVYRLTDDRGADIVLEVIGGPISAGPSNSRRSAVAFAKSGRSAVSSSVHQLCP